MNEVIFLPGSSACQICQGPLDEDSTVCTICGIENELADILGRMATVPLGLEFLEVEPPQTQEVVSGSEPAQVEELPSLEAKNPQVKEVVSEVEPAQAEVEIPLEEQEAHTDQGTINSQDKDQGLEEGDGNGDDDWLESDQLVTKLPTAEVVVKEEDAINPPDEEVEDDSPVIEQEIEELPPPPEIEELPPQETDVESEGGTTVLEPKMEEAAPSELADASKSGTQEPDAEIEDAAGDVDMPEVEPIDDDTISKLQDKESLNGDDFLKMLKAEGEEKNIAGMRDSIDGNIEGGAALDVDQGLLQELTQRAEVSDMAEDEVLSEMKEEPIAQEDVKVFKCPLCQALVEESSDTCPGCGAKFEDEDDPVAQQIHSEVEEKLISKAVGKLIANGEKRLMDIKLPAEKISPIREAIQAASQELQDSNYLPALWHALEAFDEGARNKLLVKILSATLKASKIYLKNAVDQGASTKDAQAIFKQAKVHIKAEKYKEALELLLKASESCLNAINRVKDWGVEGN